jgi:hypothetical protein
VKDFVLGDERIRQMSEFKEMDELERSSK